MGINENAGHKTNVSLKLHSALVGVLLLLSPTIYADQAFDNIWESDISIITEPADTGFVYVRNSKDGYANIKSGTHELGSIERNWKSAQWKEEKTDGYSRFQNRLKPEVYLHSEFGYLSAGKVEPGWLSARWSHKGVAMKDSGLFLRAKFQCPDPGDDGCSNPFNDKISNNLKRIFEPACNVHDRCYASPWQLSGKTGYKGHRVCDDEFEQNMSTICDGLGSESQFDCWVGKTTFYLTVKDWGHNAFDSGQSKAETNCKNKDSQVKNGSVRFFNTAGYTADVRLSYTYNGNRIHKSRDLRLGAWQEWGIPEGSTEIKIRAWAYTGLFWRPRKQIVVENWGDEPPTKCIKVFGTTSSPSYNSVCDLVDR